MIMRYLNILIIVSFSASLFANSDSTPLLIKKGTALHLSKITLDEALETALRHNGDLQKGYIDYMVSAHKSAAEDGTFEPQLVSSISVEKKSEPYSILIQHKSVFSTGIEGKLHSATRYNLGFRYTDMVNPFRKTTEDPTIFTGITLTQPLLQGLWYGAPLVHKKVAQIDLLTARESYRSLLINTIAEIEKAFWHVCYLNLIYEHSTRSVELAAQFVEDSEKRVRAGKLSKMDILEAQVGYASRINSHRAVAQELITASAQLKHLLGDSTTNAETIFQTDASYLISFERPTDSLNEDDMSVRFALQPDLRTLENHVLREEKVVRFQKDQLLPELNLTGSWGISAEGATMDVTKEMWSEGKLNRSFSAELTLKVPIAGNIKQRNLLKAEKSSLQSVKTNLRTYLDELRRSYETSTDRLEEYITAASNGEVIVEYRKQLLNNEINHLNAGKSTYREVFEQEEKLMKSRQWHLESLMNIHNTLTELKRVQGTLLVSHQYEKIENGEILLTEKFETISNNK